ncbi:hypothetical protein EYF80_004824 [Liparis tanakae]|uniref:Uncharacterized protein n=1 Tax=Liparis tanakae TaxID=230148 RepID=A0A4Z2J3H2_9TELE|nr:hypothetical protein EYF80_004824 [Liparis tanakae]
MSAGSTEELSDEARAHSGTQNPGDVTLTWRAAARPLPYTMTDSTDTGVMVTLRGKRKKRIRLHRKRHTTMEMNTCSFLE